MANQQVVVIVEVQEVFDQARLDAYRSQAREQMLARGGELIARGGSLFEGAPPLGQGLLLQRWPSERAFREWQASDDYAPLLKLRNDAVRLRMSIVPIV